MKNRSISLIVYLSFGFVLALCASCTGHVPALGVPVIKPEQTGILYLYNKQNQQACSFIASDGQYSFQNSSGNRCPNDTIYSWRVQEGKPGTIFTFKDSPNCTGSEPSYSFLLTGPAGGSVTTPSDVFIPLSFSGESGQDIITGVQAYSHGVTGTMSGKLSCINIWQHPGN